MTPREPMTDAERAARYTHEYWRTALEPLCGLAEADRLWATFDQLRRDTNAALVTLWLQRIAERV